MFYQVEGNTITLNRSEFAEAIRGNWHGNTVIPVAGTSVKIPSWDYDGSGEVIENFNEFTAIPPQGESIPDYREWSLETDGTREEYMDHFAANGWASIQEDWDAWIENCVDHLIRSWNPQEGIDEEWSVYDWEDPPLLEVIFDEIL